MTEVYQIIMSWKGGHELEAGAWIYIYRFLVYLDISTKSWEVSVFCHSKQSFDRFLLFTNELKLEKFKCLRYLGVEILWSSV